MAKDKATAAIKNELAQAKDNMEETKGFIQKATDTFHELLFLFLGLIIVAGGLYALFEDKNLLQGLWWALKTGFSVGYGDIVPHTGAGQVVGTVLMSITTFVFIPLVTATIALKLIMASLKPYLTRLVAFLNAHEVAENQVKKAVTKKATAAKVK